jgi:hypothetical protein
VTPAKGKKEAQRLLLKTSLPEGQSAQQLKFSVDYLSFFGYIAVELLKNMNMKDLEKAVKTFQRWFGLKADGVVGPMTLRAMEIPRCGCPDVIDEANNVHKQYMQMQAVIEENMAKWNKKGLTYAVHSYVGGMSKTAQLKIFAGAWKAWDDVCGLNIQAIGDVDKADLVLSTGSGSRHSFDGRGGTLAWAYLPNGRDRQLLMRFDLAETWISNPRERGILLFNVACHEFGHMIGLTHSKKKGALMAPYYNPGVAVPQWDDDIPRAEARYGKDTAPQPPKPPKPPKPDPGTPGTDDEEIFHVQCKGLKVDGYTLFADK